MLLLDGGGRGRRRHGRLRRGHRRGHWIRSVGEVNHRPTAAPARGGGVDLDHLEPVLGALLGVGGAGQGGGEVVLEVVRHDVGGHGAVDGLDHLDVAQRGAAVPLALLRVSAGGLSGLLGLGGLADLSAAVPQELNVLQEGILGL